MRARGLVPGSGESFSTYTISRWCERQPRYRYGYSWCRIPESTTGWCRPWIPFAHLKEKRGQSGVLCRLKRESRSFSVTPGHQRLLSIPGRQRPLVYTRASTSAVWIRSSIVLLFILGHQQFFVYTRSLAISSFIPGHQWFLVYTRGEASYSHQWPRCGECFLGR